MIHLKNSFDIHDSFVIVFHPVLKITSLRVTLNHSQVDRSGTKISIAFSVFFCRGVWGHAPQKILKIRRSETLFSAISVI